jgi:hypothetical protein
MEVKEDGYIIPLQILLLKQAWHGGWLYDY